MKNLNINSSANTPIFRQNFLKNTYRQGLNKLERTPSVDIVSFSGHKKVEKKLSPNIQSALEYSSEILALDSQDITLENVSKVTRKYAQDASVHELSEMEDKVRDPESFGAFFLAKIDKNLEPSTNELYFDLPNGEIDDMQKLLFASDCAHEFTHLKQMQTLEMSKLLKTMTKGDVEYGKAIMSIGNAIFDIFHTQVQGQILAPVFREYMDLRQFQKYQVITPLEAPIDRRRVILAFRADSEQEARKILVNTFCTVFENAYAQVLRQADILEMIPKGESKESLMKKVMTYCSKKAKEEKEAYMAESELSRKVLNTKETLNIDAFPIYYDILAKALERH